MEQSIKNLCRNPIFYYFRKLSDIPHGSYNEKAISDYVLKWALEHGLEAMQDSVNNILIRKPATPGYENMPTVMLQAHLDMVCEKIKGSKHDFTKDPIKWVVEGDLLSTGGETTLGADDGIGVAIAMAVLDDDTLIHPKMEVLFTVCEEEDFTGAKNFNQDERLASYLINIDNTMENVIISGSCGGMKVEFRANFKEETLTNNFKPYSLQISGLRGGHSGEDIHRGRGSANALLIRVLRKIGNVGKYFISEIRGGSFRLAISRDAEAVIWIDDENLRDVEKCLSEIREAFVQEMPMTSESIIVKLQPAAVQTNKAIVPDKLIRALTLMPDGIYKMSEAIEGIVDTSINMGEIYLNSGNLLIVSEIRSLRESLQMDVYEKIQVTAEMLNGTCSYSDAYPSWDFHPKSKLREIYSNACKKISGTDIEILTVHAGLEVGFFFLGEDKPDAISIGPDMWDFHSPTETLKISSCKRVYQYLCETLKTLCEEKK